MTPRVAGLWLLSLASCATLASPGGGDQNLPSSGVGPFAPLTRAEVAPGDLAPFVFLSQAQAYRDPGVLADPADPSGAGVLLYAVAKGPSGSAIVRTRSTDGRSFYGDTASNEGVVQHKPPVVLTASAPWEGTDLSGPSPLRTPSGPIWLYYAAAGGIGLAKSSDGLTFTKTPAPVLGPDAGVGWEFTPPRAPSVAIFPDGTWHMLYASGDAIGEATSADGETWRRVDADPSTPAMDPVFEPSARVDPEALAPGESPPFDEGAVDDPLLSPRIDPAGRLQVRLLYAGYSAPLGASVRTSAIGVAGRYGTSGRFSRQPQPVYTMQSNEAAPALFEHAGLSMLYVTQDNSSVTPGTVFTAVAAAFAPATASLGPAAPFPSSP